MLPDDSNPSPPKGRNAPVAAQYVATFLKPEMLHIYRQIIALRAFQPVVLCQKREHEGDFPFENIQVLPKPRTHALRRLWQKQILGRPITIYRSEARRILDALHTANATVLHVYFGHIGVHLLPLLEICPLPVIVSFHGADAGVDLDRSAHLTATRRMLDQATLLLARSESLAERLVAIGADPLKIRLHRTGIPLTDIPFRSRTPPSGKAWHCVQACRLIPKKGLPTSLRAFAEFCRTYPHSSFTIAGEGPQQAQLQALAGELGVADRVQFVGFLSQEKLRSLYAEAHFFLHPSEMGANGDQEGVPNAMLEAMASGLPIVATKHGGIPEAVENGISGYLTPEQDASALAKSMLILAGDPALYSQVGKAARDRVSRQFDISAQTRVLESYYGEAIEAAALNPRQRTS